MRNYIIICAFLLSFNGVMDCFPLSPITQKRIERLRKKGESAIENDLNKWIDHRENKSSVQRLYEYYTYKNSDNHDSFNSFSYKIKKKVDVICQDDNLNDDVKDQIIKELGQAWDEHSLKCAERNIKGWLLSDMRDLENAFDRYTNVIEWHYGLIVNPVSDQNARVKKSRHLVSIFQKEAKNALDTFQDSNTQNKDLRLFIENLKR